MSPARAVAGRRARKHRMAPALSIAAAAFLLSGCGITGNFRMNPGYAEFDSPGLPHADRELALSLGPIPLKIANVVLVHDPILSSILRDVRAVRVYTYAVDGDNALAREHIEDARSRFVAGGWRPVAVVHDDGEFTAALVRLDAPEKIRGVVVMSAGREEVVYVNAIGKIRPKTFDRLMAEVGIGSLFEDRDEAAEHRDETAENRRETAENDREAAENEREAAENRVEVAENRLQPDPG